MHDIVMKYEALRFAINEIAREQSIIIEHQRREAMIAPIFVYEQS